MIVGDTADFREKNLVIAFRTQYLFGYPRLQLQCTSYRTHPKLGNLD
jgi:hypothetical protein